MVGYEMLINLGAFIGFILFLGFITKITVKQMNEKKK